MLYSKLLHTIKLKTRRIAKTNKTKMKVKIIRRNKNAKTLRLNRKSIILAHSGCTSSNKLSENAHLEINKENLRPLDQKPNQISHLPAFSKPF